MEQPGEAEDLHTPYLDNEGRLELRGWARDALVLALPRASALPRGLPRPLSGLRRGPQLGRPRASTVTRAGGDPRWAKLSELKLE